MNVKQLMEILKRADPKAKVIVHNPWEGTPGEQLEVTNVAHGFLYSAEDRRKKIPKLTDEYKRLGYNEDDVADKNDAPCILLAPSGRKI